MPAPNWSRPLPRPLAISDKLILETLADVRVLLERHLPPDHREQPIWLQVNNMLHGAALGQDEPRDVEIALRTVLSIEGILRHQKAALPAALDDR